MSTFCQCQGQGIGQSLAKIRYGLDIPDISYFFLKPCLTADREDKGDGWGGSRRIDTNCPFILIMVTRDVLIALKYASVA